MNYPRTRMRRLRSDDFIRRATAETVLSVDDFILPLFVHDQKTCAPVAAMPGVFRLSMDGLWRAAAAAAAQKIPALALFAAVDDGQKTADGKEALNENGLIPRAIAGIKSRFPNLGVVADVALDPYTTHGHDGLVDDNGKVMNDETVSVLARQSLLLAAAGADIVAPSDMMDGRVGVIRDALESAKFFEVKILSYSAKYASSFYAPFRRALGADKNLGRADKRAYQMNCANRREAMREMELDLQEGADILMVKPAMPCLDVICEAAKTFDAPIFAYQVSGEYAMIKAAAANGMLDESASMLESLIAVKRAGARAIITYFATAAAKLISS